MLNKNFVHDAELENAVFDSHSFIFFPVMSVDSVLLFLSVEWAENSSVFYMKIAFRFNPTTSKYFTTFSCQSLVRSM